MVATSDILTIVFGIAATLLAGVAIWATRRYNNRTKEREPLVYPDEQHALEQGSDVELGLLDHTSPANLTNDFTENEVINTLKISTQHIVQQRNSLHEVIGDALEVFSKHLRAK